MVRIKSGGRFGFGGSTVLSACREDQVSFNTTVGEGGGYVNVQYLEDEQTKAQPSAFVQSGT